MKKFLEKILPKKIYSSLVRFSKIPLSMKAASGARHSKKLKSKKKILIIKSDAIGDYVMFRNFIKEIKQSKKYRGYEIHLLGNIIWKNLFENLDKNYVDKPHFINRKELYSRKTIGPLLESLNREAFELVLHPVSHREFAIDYIIKKISSPNKISYSGTSMNQGALEKSFTDKYYTKLIKTKSKFEFDRNREFFEAVIGEKINLPNPRIDLKSKQGNYFVVNPGASVKFRQWKPENFAKVADHLIKKYKSKIYIVGSKAELALDEKVKFLTKNKNKVEIKNNGSLFDLLKLIAGSRGVVSNETCTSHMAVALGKKVYCVASGIGWGSTYPYPHYKNAIYFYPVSLDKTNPNKKILDVNETSAAAALKEIKF